jgi:hypothetical protein
MEKQINVGDWVSHSQLAPDHKLLVVKVDTDILTVRYYDGKFHTVDLYSFEVSPFDIDRYNELPFA